jgi:hypothetical protein
MKPINPCIVCGNRPFTPGEYCDGGYVLSCYRDAGNHSLMITGATPEATVERWNHLNPSHVPAPATRQTILELIRAKLRR